MKCFSISLMVIMLFSFSSCSKKSKGGDVIPKNAEIVVITNVYDLTNKAQVEDLPKSDFLKKASEKLKDKSKETEAVLDKIKDNPLLLGIDLLKDVFLFTIENEESGRYMCLSVDLFNSNKLETFVEEDLIKLYPKAKIVRSSNYSYTLLEETIALGWDDDKAVIMVAKDARAKQNIATSIQDLLALKKDFSLIENKNFSQFYKEESDIKVWLDPHKIDEGKVKTLEEILHADLQDNYISFSFAFKEGAVVLESSYGENYSRATEVTEYFNTGLLQLIPQDYYAMGSLSFDPNNPDFFTTVLEQFKHEDKMLTANIKQLLSKCKGSLVYAFYGEKEYEFTHKESVYNEFDFTYEYKEVETIETAPYFCLAFDIQEEAVLTEDVISMFGGSVQPHEGFYEITIQDKFSVYYFMNTAFFYVTNDLDAIKRIVKKASLDKHIDNKNIKQACSDNLAYAFVKSNTEDYPVSIQNSFISNDSNYKDLLPLWDDFVGNIEFKQSDATHTTLVLNTKNAKENSLYLLLSLINSNSKVIEPYVSNYDIEKELMKMD